MVYTPHQHKYFSWELTHRRSSSDDEKLTAVLSEAQVDLNPHQVEAALFAFRSPLSMGTILADEVGLGKTIEASLVISQQWAEHKRHILIIVPATLRKQWSVELEEKFFLPSTILERKNFNAILNETYKNPFDNSDKIIICSYQFAKKQINHIRRVNWDLVVLDEAHKLRNVYKSSNKTAIVIKESLQPFKKLMLTATPLQNDVKELYGLISIIDDNYFGNLQSFGVQYSKVALRDDNSYQELRSRIKSVVHRTLRSDVQEYVKYTERTPMVQEYYPSDAEKELSEKVTDYLQREECYGLPRGQRSLITLVLHKLLSSSSFAIAGTLQTIIDRLENLIKENREYNEQFEESIENDFETFDEDVVRKLRIRKDTDQERLSHFNKLLWELTVDVLNDYITIKDSDNCIFRLNKSPQSKLTAPLGSYQFGKNTTLAYIYRLSHPLADWVIEKSKETDTPPANLVFDYTNHPAKISILNQYKGQSGYLSVVLVQFTSLKEYEEHLIYGVVDDAGNVLDDDFAQKLLSVSAETGGTLDNIENEKLSSVLIEERTKRNEIFEVEDEIERRRDEIITQIGDSLKQQITQKELFTIRWAIK